MVYLGGSSRASRSPVRFGPRRQRQLTRAAPLLLLAAVAFVVGVIAGSGAGQDEQALVRRYVAAWTHGDVNRMYSLLDTSSQHSISESQFAGQLSAAATAATLVSLKSLSQGDQSGDVIPVGMVMRTRIFGRLREVLRVPISGSGSDARIHFSTSLTFPGLQEGEQLSRQSELPPRADILARDGTPLAQGATRSSPIPSVAAEIAGTLGPIPAAETSTYAAAGYPPGVKVGISGLERVFQQRVAGTPGGTLLAGKRVLARVAPRPGATVRSTISPPLERAAVTAMAGRYAGIAVMDPRTGGLLALAGVAFSALQPPGSTMKIVTATGALEAGIVKLSSTFPIHTAATIDGFTLQNANGEACGGTFLNAFAVSCNSVFAPLGAKLGGKRLLDIAQRFGFNQPPVIPGAAEPSIPARSLTDSLSVGSSAIGQGDVQSTALGMTEVAATIAMKGRRPLPTLLDGAPPRSVPVVSPRVAGLVQRMMVAVVQFGTGTSAQISGVKVAGKTGTAELRNTAGGASSPSNTDAWFVGYAPVDDPRVVVGALFPEQGAGGQTAAPAVHDVLAAALKQK